MTDQTISGVLNIDKPAGWTSHDVVARVRRLSGVRQVGHAGTLDPMATGVLVVCLGHATRLIEYLAGEPKVYLAEITLGAATDTYDATGQVTAEAPVPALTNEQIDQGLERFRGDIMQTPPAFSAIKQGGVALYKRARRGETVEVAARPVTVYELALLAFDGRILQARVKCSAGTYIRSIAHDLGQVLGCGAHLSRLRRTAVGNFDVASAVTLDQLVAAGDGWQAHLAPIDATVAHLGRLVLPDADASRLLHGQSIRADGVAGEGPVRAYDSAGRLLAIVSYDTGRQAWRPLKVMS